MQSCQVKRSQTIFKKPGRSIRQRLKKKKVIISHFWYFFFRPAFFKMPQWAAIAANNLATLAEGAMRCVRCEEEKRKFTPVVVRHGRGRPRGDLPVPVPVPFLAVLRGGGPRQPGEPVRRRGQPREPPRVHRRGRRGGGGGGLLGRAGVLALDVEMVAGGVGAEGG